MPYSQERLAEGDNSPGAKFQHFQRRFHGYRMQSSGTEKANLRKTFCNYLFCQLGGRWKKFSRCLNQGIKRHSVSARVLKMGQALTRYHHVRERTSHRQSPVVYLVVKYHAVDVAAVTNCSRHPTLAIAAHNNVMN